VIVGAHDDTERNTSGAEDNASGVAAMLEIARLMHDTHPRRTVRFVAFTNEELPYFHSSVMGSIRYARMCPERGDKILVAFSLDMLGVYAREPGPNVYPWPFGRYLPATADFILFHGRNRELALVARCVKFFRDTTTFPCEGATIPGWYPGAWSSDHAPFWRYGYPAIHVRSVARYPCIHMPCDTPEKLDYTAEARVTVGMARVMEDLAESPGAAGPTTRDTK